MAKSDARFEFKANLGRTDFDLSQRLGLTSAAGMLLPVWCDFASPGDSYYMQHDLPLLRSSVLAQPAMIDCLVHFETFFVPMQMIYQPFEQTMFSLKDFQSNNFDPFNANLKNNDFPLFDYQDFITNVIGVSNPANDYHADAFRLADLLGLCPDNFTVASLQSTYAPSFFPWQLLAYHTIYQYYYRLDDKSQFENSYCNFDKYYNATAAVKMTRDFMMIHQRPWHFDYFTSVYRSPLVSDDNMQFMNLQNPNSELAGGPRIMINRNGTPISSNSDTTTIGTNASSPVLPPELARNASPAAIRQLFANEKLAMITGRTKKNYDSQVLAHYGINVPHDVKHDLTMIHHDEYDLRVQEVTSLSSSSSEPLGEMAGKSYAAGNGAQFKFTAPVHGVIMTILSVEPKKRYFGNFDRINAITDAFDLPTPEYDRLGNQPMYRYECGYMPTIGDTRSNTDIIAWKERYYANKRKYDKCTYAFGYTNQALYVNNWAAYMLAFRPFATCWDNNNAPDQRPDLEGRFYIERNAMDSVCVVPFVYGWASDAQGEMWDNTPWLAYQRDPFIINSHIKCKKVSWMSKDGEPIYNF